MPQENGTKVCLPVRNTYLSQRKWKKKKKEEEEEMSSTFDWEQSLRFGTSIKETWLN